MPRKHARPAARKARKAIREAMPPRPRRFPEDPRAKWAISMLPKFRGWPVLDHRFPPRNDSYLEAAFLAARRGGKKEMMTEALKQVVATGLAIVESVPRGGDDWVLDRIHRPDVWNIDSPEDCESVEITLPEGWTLGGEAKTIIGLPSGRNVRVEFNEDMTAYTVFKDGKVFKTGEF